MSRSVVALLSLSALVACATYDGLPEHLNPLGDSGSGGSDSGGRASEGGGAAGTNASAGNTATAGSGATSGGTKDVGDGGAPSADIGGNSDMGGTAAGGIAAMGGKAGSGGTASGSGGSVSGGGGGSGGSAGKGGSGGTAGSGGSGGSGAATCTSKSPDPSCTCVTHGAQEYWFCSTYLTFAAAEKKCTAVGMHLPKVETKAEDDFLFGTCVTLSMGEYFLGATDASAPDTWTWLAGGTFWVGVADGTPTGYTNWSPNEPNASGDCLVVQSNDRWDDRTCTDQRKYICEAQ